MEVVLAGRECHFSATVCVCVCECVCVCVCVCLCVYTITPRSSRYLAHKDLPVTRQKAAVKQRRLLSLSSSTLNISHLSFPHPPLSIYLPSLALSIFPLPFSSPRLSLPHHLCSLCFTLSVSHSI